ALTLASAPGQGASFAFAAHLPAASDARAARPDLAGQRVLIVAPADIEAALVARHLTAWGAEVRIVESAADARAQLAGQSRVAAAHAGGTPFDLVLMDVHMPGVDGMTATHLIRVAEERHNRARTRIVALTADVTETDREACIAAGMDGFLTKPLDRDRLLDTI